MFFNFFLRTRRKPWPLFLNESCRAMAVSLIGLFSSIFVYKRLILLLEEEKLAFLGVFLYFLVAYLFKFISCLFAEELALRWGLKKQIYFGYLFLALSLGALFFSFTNPWFLLAAPIFLGLSNGFYWFGWHGLMVKTGLSKIFGTALGMSGMLTRIFLIGGPFLGGIAIALAGYPGLFLLIFLFVISGSLTLIKIREEKTHRDTSFWEVWSLFKSHRRTLLAYGGYSLATTIYATTFPLYLFLILKQELSLGGFFSLSMMLAALIDFLVGRWVDMRGRFGPLSLGSVVSFLAWLGRIASRNPSSLLVWDVTDRFAGETVGIPLGVLSYQKALDGHSTGRAILFREVALSLGSMMACLLVLGLIFFGGRLEHAFYLAALFSLSPLLVAKYG